MVVRGQTEVESVGKLEPYGIITVDGNRMTHMRAGRTTLGDVLW